MHRVQLNHSYLFCYVGENTGSRGDRHTSHRMDVAKFLEPGTGIVVMGGGLVKTLLPGFLRDEKSDPWKAQKRQGGTIIIDLPV